MTTTFGHAFQPVGPGPKNSGPGPEVRVRGPQKVPGPDLDRTLDSLGPALGQCTHSPQCRIRRR